MHEHPATLSQEVFVPSFIHLAKTLVMSCGTDVPEHCGHSLMSWRAFWVLELGPWPVSDVWWAVGLPARSGRIVLCVGMLPSWVCSPNPAVGLGHHGAGVNQALREFVIHLDRQKLPCAKVVSVAEDSLPEQAWGPRRGGRPAPRDDPQRAV